MNKNLAIGLTMLVFSACSNGKSGDKKAELDDLKKQEAVIREKIASLEADLSKTGVKSDVKSVQVIVQKINPVEFRHFVEVQAHVDGDDNVFVSPQMQGIVKNIAAKAGDKVSKGQVIVQLDDEVYQRSLEELQASRSFLNTLYQKQKTLWDQKIGTEIQYLTAKNNLESIDKKIATVREQIELSKVKSPINGTIDRLEVKVGQALVPGMQNIRVVNFDRLKVKAEVSEAYVSKIKQGDEVEVYFPDLDKTIQSKLSYAGKVIDEMSRTFSVEVMMNSNEVTMHPNMVAILRIADYKNNKALVLPVGVVQTTPQGSYVFTAENGKAVKKPVAVGRDYKGSAEITGGLNAGDPVITEGYQSIVDGQPVNF